jgi:hypothetical protein
MSLTSAPVVPCSCAEGWKPEGWAYCAECYEGKIERLRELITDAIDEYPVASGLYVDSDGQDGYGSLKAMRFHLGIPSSYPIPPAQCNTPGEA